MPRLSTNPGSMGIKRVLLFLLMTCCASHFVSAQVVLRDTAHIFPKAPPGRSGVQQAPGADAPFEGIVTLAEAGEVRLRMNCANAPWPWWFGPPIFTGAVSPTEASCGPVPGGLRSSDQTQRRRGL
jgi:hypothetical protein